MSAPRENFKKLRHRRETFRQGPPGRTEWVDWRPLSIHSGTVLLPVDVRHDVADKAGAENNGRVASKPKPLGGADGLPESTDWKGLERIQIGDQVTQCERLLLGLLGHPIDLFKGRDPADHLQHPIGVKR